MSLDGASSAAGSSSPVPRAPPPLVPRLHAPSLIAAAGQAGAWLRPRLVNATISLVLSDTTEPTGQYYGGMPPCGDGATLDPLTSSNPDGKRCDPSQFLVGSRRQIAAATAALPVLLMMMVAMYNQFGPEYVVAAIALLALNTQHIHLERCGSPPPLPATRGIWQLMQPGANAGVGVLVAAPSHATSTHCHRPRCQRRHPPTSPAPRPCAPRSLLLGLLIVALGFLGELVYSGARYIA
jgi:hypothetical protein